MPRDGQLDPAPIVNLLLEYYVTPRVSLRTDFGVTNPGFVRESSDSLRQFPLRVDLNYNWEGGKWHPFVGTGVGAYFIQFRDNGESFGSSETKLGLNLGGGVEYFTGRTVSLKGEARYHMLGPMLRNLLEDRFKLKIRRATDEQPMYVMTVAKGGLKIAPESCTERDPANPPTREELLALRNGGKPMCGNMNMTSGEGGTHRWVIGGQTMTGFAGTLSTFMDHHVENKTGVDGSFNIRLEFALDEHVPGPDKRYGPPTNVPESSGPNIFKALEQQLGLTLEPTKGPHGFLVIEHIERPSPNSGPAIARGR